jgi:hypothetical protein
MSETNGNWLCDSKGGRGKEFLFTIMSRLTLGLKQPPMQQVLDALFVSVSG